MKINAKIPAQPKPSDKKNKKHGSYRTKHRMKGYGVLSQMLERERKRALAMRIKP